MINASEICNTVCAVVAIITLGIVLHSCNKQQADVEKLKIERNCFKGDGEVSDTANRR